MSAASKYTTENIEVIYTVYIIITETVHVVTVKFLLKIIWFYKLN